MMNLLKEELFIITRRRKIIYALISTAIFSIILIALTFYLDSIDDREAKDLPIDKIAHGILGFSYPLIMLWTVLTIGQELSHGYVNRAVVATSRRYYFLSKLGFCTILSVFFTFLGVINFLISFLCSSDTRFVIDNFFLMQFAVQLLLASLLYSLSYMCIVFAIRSPLASAITCYFWPQVEGFVRLVFKSEIGIDLNILPFQLIHSVHMKPSSASNSLYDYVPLNDPLIAVVPIISVTTFAFFSYRWFLKRDLKPLSD